MKKKILALVATLCVVGMLILTVYIDNFSEKKDIDTDDFSYVESESKDFISEKESTLIKIIKKLLNIEDYSMGEKYVVDTGNSGKSDPSIPIVENNNQPQRIKLSVSKPSNSGSSASADYYYDNSQDKKYRVNNNLFTLASVAANGGGSKNVGNAGFDDSAFPMSIMLTAQNTRGGSSIDPNTSTVTPGDIGDQDIPGPIGDGLPVLITFSLIFIFVRKLKLN